jgi:Na+-transporting NADH:ubiquinone oxidoreductase subunit F
MNWTLMGIALVVLNGLVLGLCVLLLVSRRMFASYGTVKITVNNEQEISAQGGSSLLSTLFLHKLFIPSACGGKGTCGYCKVKGKAGAGEVLATEEIVLTPQEIADNVRLACQVRVRNDIAVEIPEEFLAIREYTMCLEKSEIMNELIKKLTFKLIEPAVITFKPGQYIQIGREYEGELVQRGYSVANVPSDNTHIELNVRRVENGIMSTYLHQLQVGDRLTVTGPFGEFFLQETTNRSIVCVAGGVGLAPMKSIIHYALDKNLPRTIYLFYGARTLSFLYDHEIFVELAAKHSNFRYIPALSEVGPDDPWKGERGFIHQIFQRVFPEGEPAEAYLCGPPIMIESLTPVLREKGITEKDTYYDEF